MNPMRLQGVDGWLLVSELDWQAVCRLALLFGWTAEDEGDEFVFLSRRNAADFAATLRVALDAIPSGDIMPADEVERLKEQPQPWSDADYQRWFSGPAGRDLVGRVIRLAEKGALSLVPLN